MRIAARRLLVSRVVRAVALDALLILACWAEGFANQTPGWNRPFVLSVLTLVAIPLRRWSPEAAVVLGVPALGWAQSTLAPAVLLFTLGERQRRAWVLYAFTALAVVVVLWPQWDPGLLAANTSVVLGELVFVAGAVGLGALRRSLALERRQRLELEEARAAERAAAAATARAEERAHLAREMHDVVAHHVSLIAVQAGALQVSTREESTREAAAGLRSLASSAISELRQVLGVLRSPTATGAPLLGHGLCELPRLVDTAAPGSRWSIDPRLLSDDDGASVRVPDAVHGTVYRVVQEGLTNARKHAPGSPVAVDVSLSEDSRQLQVEVVTQLRTTTAAAGSNPAPRADLGIGGAGVGLVGLRERAESLGGSVHVERTAAEHRLRVLLPLGADA
ncbi:Signal transduction histidine kinase [Quadrisphaera granulorum]|uniref:histidine kinase n=1 Tax=Quadrisphaera granulorum TaxID=317664 RepID=A0A315ZJY6_9ACTN|nr:histidine kinase [Quadrisphaera granulorum]PWJ45602.1 signal transduction histidine kinase [Quadrisphaera granulorum]SZE99157.1 Signal transduction histidine kinase [Quadrisphaera granulorum]